jgi:hypothetical protein
MSKPCFRMFNKSELKRVFDISHSEKLSDEEFQHRGSFIVQTMMWNQYETKCYLQDFIPFSHRFKPNWKELYAFHKANPDEIKRTNPLLPRLPEESDKDYNKRLDQFEATD